MIEAMKLKDIFRRKPVAANGRSGGDTHYELWSRDTFEGRTFLCAVFDNYEEARAALDQCRQDALSQDEALRDSYWLAGTDIAGILERERRERERLSACRLEEGYNPEHPTFVLDDPAIDGLVEKLRDPDTRQKLFETAGHLIREHYAGNRP